MTAWKWRKPVKDKQRQEGWMDGEARDPGWIIWCQSFFPFIPLLCASPLTLLHCCCLFVSPVLLCSPAGLAPDLFSSMFSIILEKWRADCLIFYDIPLAWAREREKVRGEKMEYEDEILKFLNPNSRIHAGSRSLCVEARTHTKHMHSCSHAETTLKSYKTHPPERVIFVYQF